MDLLVVEIGERRVALRSSDVREVVAFSTVTPVPLAPPLLTGLTQVRGQIIPVIDLVEPMHLARPTDSLVLVEAGGARAALLVDRVIGVVQSGGEAPLDIAALFARLRSQIHEVNRRT